MRTVACFDVIALISAGDYSVHTTFCGDYPCEHYFYVPWLIMTSQWVITLLETLIVTLQWVMTLLETSIVMSQ